ncbi:MAG: hypothetical protein ACREN1_01735 [Candidatus Dormibacteria bacterium]
MTLSAILYLVIVGGLVLAFIFWGGHTVDKHNRQRAERDRWVDEQRRREGRSD